MTDPQLTNSYLASRTQIVQLRNSLDQAQIQLDRIINQLLPTTDGPTAPSIDVEKLIAAVDKIGTWSGREPAVLVNRHEVKRVIRETAAGTPPKTDEEVNTDVMERAVEVMIHAIWIAPPGASANSTAEAILKGLELNGIKLT